MARTGDCHQEGIVGGVTIVELVWPGTWLALSDQQQASELAGLLQLLETAVGEANLSLLMFERREASVAAIRVPSQDEWLADMAERRAAERRLENALAPMSVEQQFAALEGIRLQAEIEVLRARSARGLIPAGLMHHEPFIWARTFVYALDAIRKTLTVIAQQPTPNSAAGALIELDQRIPDLLGVRDTAHHPEDRIRRLDKKGKPITLQPIDNNMIKAPSGGVLVLNNLNGSRYGCTLGDGRFAEVDVTASSLIAARDVVQRVFDSLPWRGPRQLFPRP